MNLAYLGAIMAFVATFNSLFNYGSTWSFMLSMSLLCIGTALAVYEIKRRTGWLNEEE